MHSDYLVLVLELEYNYHDSLKMLQFHIQELMETSRQGLKRTSGGSTYKNYMSDIYFRQKAPASEVGALPPTRNQGWCPPTGNDRVALKITLIMLKEMILNQKNTFSEVDLETFPRNPR